MFLRFYTGSDIEQKADRFVDIIGKTGKPVSPAQVQGFFMFFKDDPDGVFRKCHRLEKVIIMTPVTCCCIK